MAQYTEGQQLRGSDGKIYVVRNGVPSLPVGGQVSGADPYKVADEQRKQQAAALALQASERANNNSATANSNSAAATQLAREKFNAELAEKGLMVGPDGKITALQGNVALPKPALTGAQYSDALAQFNAAMYLKDSIGKLKSLNAAGPGATKGIYGAADFLPTQANSNFNKEADRLRAWAKQGTGTTGGENNSVAEMKLNLGAYIPNSWDYDSTNEGTFSSLQALAEKSYAESIQRLGGIPDASGRIAPIDANVGPPPLFSDKQESEQDDMAGASPPQGTDTTNPIIGSGNGAPLPGGFAPYGAKTRIEKDPARAGLNSEVIGMIKGGVDPALINQHIASRGGVPASPQVLSQAIQYARQNPKWAGVDLETREVPMSGLQQFANNAPQTRLGTAATMTGNAGGLGIPQMLAGDESFDYLRAQNPGSAFVGDVAGMIGATSLIRKGGQELAEGAIKGLGNTGRKGLFGRKGSVLLNKFANKRGNDFSRQLLADASFGGIYGATTEGDPLTGALTAGLGSAGGQVVGKGISNAVGGVGSKGVQYLTDQKVPLSLGQTLGNNGIVGRNLQRMEQWPVIGDMMASNGQAARDRVYQGALQDAVQPSGRTIAGSGEDALISAQSIKSNAYDTALDGVNAPADMQYLQDVAPFIRSGQGIRGDIGGEFGDVVSGKLRPAFDANRSLDGNSAQEFFQQANRHAADFQQKGAFGEDAADYMRGITGATEDMIARSNPGAIDKLKAANTINARLTPIEQATITANGKTPTPLQLRRAITSNTKNYGGRAAAATGKNVPDIVNYAADILPQTIRDSGSPGNALLPYLAPTVLGGAAAGVGTFTEDPKTAGLLAVLAAMSTKTGAKALQKGLVSRPDKLKRAGSLIGGRKARMIQGSLGTGLALPFIE